MKTTINVLSQKEISCVSGGHMFDDDCLAAVGFGLFFIGVAVFGQSLTKTMLR